jgi:hypothetical protein
LVEVVKACDAGLLVVNLLSAEKGIENQESPLVVLAIVDFSKWETRLMIKVIVWFVALLGSSLVFDARTVEPANSLLKKIEEGREHLKKESVQMILGPVGTRRVRISRRKYKEVPVTGIVGREMALAILDTDARSNRTCNKARPWIRVLSRFHPLDAARERYQLGYSLRRPGRRQGRSRQVSDIKRAQSVWRGRVVIEAVYTPYSGE